MKSPIVVFCCISLVTCLSSCTRGSQQSKPVVGTLDLIWSQIDTTVLKRDLEEYIGHSISDAKFFQIYYADQSFKTYLSRITSVSILGVEEHRTTARRYFAFVADTLGSFRRFYDSGFIQQECGTPGISVSGASIVYLNDVTLVLLEEAFNIEACGRAPTSDSVTALVFDVM